MFCLIAHCVRLQYTIPDQKPLQKHRKRKSLKYINLPVSHIVCHEKCPMAGNSCSFVSDDKNFVLGTTYYEHKLTDVICAASLCNFNMTHTYKHRILCLNNSHTDRMSNIYAYTYMYNIISIYNYINCVCFIYSLSQKYIIHICNVYHIELFSKRGKIHVMDVISSHQSNELS